MVSTSGSQYLQWVKTRTAARLNLASSGVAPYPLRDLTVGIDELEINGTTFYGYPPLQEAIAAHCGVSPNCVVAASGTSMANFLAMATLTNPGDEVCIEQPAYEPLLAIAAYLGANIKRFPYDAPETAVREGTKLVVLSDLHNPTCARQDPTKLRSLRELARNVGAKVLADEVYLECLYEKRLSSFHNDDVFVCTGSLTKAYGLGGLRCGWVLAQPDLVRRMWQFKDLVDPGAPHVTELLSVAALRSLDRIAKRAKNLLETNRTLFSQFLDACPQVEVTEPEYGTCMFPRVNGVDGDRLFDVLQRYEVDVVPGRFFGMPGHFRIGIGGEPRMFAEALQRFKMAVDALTKG